MNTPSTQFVMSRRMNIYDPPLHQISSWVDSFRDDGYPNVAPSTVVEINERLDNLSEDTSSHGGQVPSNRYDQEASKPPEKLSRSLCRTKPKYVQLTSCTFNTRPGEMDNVNSYLSYVANILDYS